MRVMLKLRGTSLAALWVAWGLLSGCGRPPSLPDPEAVAAEASDALATAGGETAQIARAAAQQVQAGQVVEAWAGFTSLSHQPELTDEQRAAAQRVVISLLPALNRAAEDGDARARALMEEHLRSK